MSEARPREHRCAECNIYVLDRPMKASEHGRGCSVGLTQAKQEIAEYHWEHSGLQAAFNDAARELASAMIGYGGQAQLWNAYDKFTAADAALREKERGK